MDLTFAHATLTQKVVGLFCILWPFLAMASVPRRGQSSAPFSAVIVALAVVVGGLWLDLAGVVHGLSMTGLGGESVAEEARWLFASTRVAIWPIAWIAVFTLVLRHRPQIDSFVLGLAGILLIHVVAAFLFVQVLAPSKALIVFARAAAAMTIVTAMTAALRLFFATARQRVDTTSAGTSHKGTI